MLFALFLIELALVVVVVVVDVILCSESWDSRLSSLALFVIWLHKLDEKVLTDRRRRRRMKGRQKPIKREKEGEFPSSLRFQ